MDKKTRYIPWFEGAVNRSVNRNTDKKSSLHHTRCRMIRTCCSIVSTVRYYAVLKIGCLHARHASLSLHDATHNAAAALHSHKVAVQEVLLAGQRIKRMTNLSA